jgi:hypothetical protein
MLPAMLPRPNGLNAAPLGSADLDLIGEPAGGGWAELIEASNRAGFVNRTIVPRLPQPSVKPSLRSGSTLRTSMTAAR